MRVPSARPDAVAKNVRRSQIMEPPEPRILAPAVGARILLPVRLYSRPEQPVVQLPRHSTSAASRGPQRVELHALGTPSRGTALHLGQIRAVFSLGAPCPPGASLVSVRRGSCTTGCGHSAARPHGNRRRESSQPVLACSRACQLPEMSGGRDGDDALRGDCAFGGEPGPSGAVFGAVRTRQHHRRRRGHDQGGAPRRLGEGHQHRHQRDDRPSSRRSPAPTAPPTFRRAPIGSRPRSRASSPRNVDGIRLDRRRDRAHRRDAEPRRHHRVGERRRQELAGADRRREGLHQHLERADRPAAARGRRRDAQRVRPRVHGARGEGQRHQRGRSAAGRAARSARRSTASR